MLLPSLARRFAALAFPLLISGAWGQTIPVNSAPGIAISSAPSSAINSPDGRPLSQRVANYSIDARLNASAKTLDATEILEYRNISTQSLTTLPFHLYLNAFRRESTFSRESFTNGLFANKFGGAVPYQHGEEGAMEIKHISAEGFGDLASSIQFTAADDGNAADHTVLEVTLPKPLAPGAVIRLQISFHDKFPLAIARSGYQRDFIMGAQWFPKIGVFENGAWNCHQYHANTEFFADFGTYNVLLRVPDAYTVGASGMQTGEHSNHDGSKTLSFEGDDIHDFAWAASPHFVAADDTFVNSLGTVKLHALVLASHAELGKRYLAVLKGSMQKFDEWYGPYPYKQITLIDPEPDADQQLGGVEYPTLFTAESWWAEPEWLTLPLELTVAHEFGHQYWYGMVATNEFEEPWLDEGINSYSELKVTDALFGRNTSIVNARTTYAGDTAFRRLSYLIEPERDPIAQPGWRFASFQSYGVIVYAKTATVLGTLESLVGEDTMRRALRVYFTRYRFTHPTGNDFLHTLEEVSGRQDLAPFLQQAIYGTDLLDYAVEPIRSGPADWWKTQGNSYHTEVTVRRKGTVVFPVKLEVGFSDGSKETAMWDGQDRWTSFTWDKPVRAVYAQVDPDNNVLLDANRFNNSYTSDARTTARYKLTNYWIFTQQLLAQWISFLV